MLESDVTLGFKQHPAPLNYTRHLSESGMPASQVVDANYTRDSCIISWYISL